MNKVKFCGLPRLDILKSVFDPDFKNGKLYWKVQRGSCKAGQEAGNLDTHGYYRVRLFGRLLYVHRVLFYLFTGKDPRDHQVDHVDLNRKNNKIKNLRLATQPQNMWNTVKSSTNSSGIKGVSWNKTNKAWYGEIKKNGRKYRTSGCPTPQVAEEELIGLRKHLHKEFTNHG